jgi:hypothetical protein
VGDAADDGGAAAGALPLQRRVTTRWASRISQQTGRSGITRNTCTCSAPRAYRQHAFERRTPACGPARFPSQASAQAVSACLPCHGRALGERARGVASCPV